MKALLTAGLILTSTLHVSAQDAAKPPSAPATKTIKVFALEHAAAKEIQRIVSELLGGRTGPNVQTSSDVNTNSLIAIGEADELAVVEALIERLDRPGQANTQDDQIAALQKRIARLEEIVAKLTANQRTAKPVRRLPAAPPRVAPPAVKSVAGTRIGLGAKGLRTPLKVETIVPVGKRVKKGDLLVKLETGPIEESISVMKIDVERHRASVIQSQSKFENSVVQKETELAEAELGLKLAELELAQFEEGTRVVERKAMEKEIQAASEELSEQKRLISAGEANPATLKSLELQLEVAKTQLEVFEKFTVPVRKIELRGGIDTAKRLVAQVRTSAESNIAAAKASVRQHETQLDILQRQLDRQKQLLEQCHVVAPHDGVIAPAPTPIRSGSVVRTGQTLLVITPVDEPQGR